MYLRAKTALITCQACSWLVLRQGLTSGDQTTSRPIALKACSPSSRQSDIDLQPGLGLPVRTNTACLYLAEVLTFCPAWSCQ